MLKRGRSGIRRHVGDLDSHYCACSFYYFLRSPPTVVLEIRKVSSTIPFNSLNNLPYPLKQRPRSPRLAPTANLSNSRQGSWLMLFL